jgi:uncharacterized NAD(P)/FAD-binding protein YdhS
VSGLTAIDAALTLAGRGHRGPIRMISRHGLLPRMHDPRGPRPLAAPNAAPPAPTARALVAWIRRAIADAGGDWRAVVDAIRPLTNDIWRGLPEAERARLLRHTARHWEVHRHRVAPQVGRAVAALVASGGLELSVGTVMRVERGTRDACRVLVRDAQGTHSNLDAAWVINCMGPNFDLRDSASPLIHSLLRSGAARPGPLGQGLDVTRDGSLIDQLGFVSPVVSVVGPLRRGVEWETTAVPEIRAQAEELAIRVGAARRARRVRGARPASPASHGERTPFDRRPALSGIEVV